MLEALDARLTDLERQAPRGLVIASAKEGFIAGADVREFAQVRTPEEALPFVRAAHAILERLERLPCPTIAAINGYCLGGGLELALACRYRVCVDNPKTVLGFPEVMLGIHPGFGGTVRSVRLIGVTAAMDLMLTGRNVRPDKALALGLVDRLAPAAELRTVARSMALDPPTRRSAPLPQRLLSFAPVRGLVAPKILAQVACTPHDRGERFVELFIGAGQSPVQSPLELVERGGEHQAFFGTVRHRLARVAYARVHACPGRPRERQRCEEHGGSVADVTQRARGLLDLLDLEWCGRQ